MNKIFKLMALVCLLAAGLVSCAPEELSTDQFSDDSVVLSGFAPNPVARGGALRIIGSNLDRVESVIIPGVDPITDIKLVSAGKNSEIRVIVPVNGPEIGKIAIVSGGETFTSFTDLTYSEPIVFTDFSPKNAMPGDVITIKGDYMNNIREIIFEGDAYVTEFEEQSRYEMKVVVPSAAVTGKIIIGDVDEANNPDGAIANLFYSEADLVIGDPTVKTASIGALKVGDAVKVTGDHLDMIKTVLFRTEAGDTEVNFTLAENAKSIEVALPENVVDGNVVLVSYAGKEFEAGAYTTVVPTKLSVAAEEVYKAGKNVIVSGSDLDLVTGVALSGQATTFSYADGKIKFVIPETSPDGTAVLTLANGKTVETEAIELVKPVIISLTPLELYAGDENITVSGSDLDLVTGVTLGGKAAEFEYNEGTIVIKTELTSVSGKVALSLANGYVTESADEVKVNYHSLVIVTDMPAAQHIGEEVVLKGSNYDLVENIFIGDVKVTKYSLRTPDEVRFLMPWNIAGMYSIQFHLFNGDVETVPTQIEVQLEREFTTIWEGNEHIAWSGMSALSWGAYDWSKVKAGTTLIAHFTLDADQEYWQIRFANGSWSSLPSGLATGASEGNIPLTAGATYYALKLTAEDIDALVNQGGLVMTGTNYTLTKLELVTEISQEKIIWEGEADPANWGNNLELGEPDGASWRNANLQVGQVIKIYFNCTDPENWGIQIFGPHWGDMLAPKFDNSNSDVSLGYIQLEVTEAIHTALTDSQNWGKSIILQGGGIIFTKITLL